MSTGGTTRKNSSTSAAPSVPLREFALQEARYAMLARSDPERSEMLLELAQDAIDERWRYYEQLADVERRLPSLGHHDEAVAVDVSAPTAEGAEGAGSE